MWLLPAIEEDSDRCGILPNSAEAKRWPGRKEQASFADVYNGWMVSVIDKIKNHLAGIIRIHVHFSIIGDFFGTLD